MRKRTSYTEEFKRDAMALVTEQGYKVPEAARSLGINENNLRRWIKETEQLQSGERLSQDEREELRRLRKENRELQMEKEILKKASAYFAKEMKSTAWMPEVEQRRSSCREVWLYQGTTQKLPSCICLPRNGGETGQLLCLEKARCQGYSS